MARHKIVRKLDSPNELATPIIRDILGRPLSHILEDEVKIPVRDMYSWARRSCTDRMEEIRKKGKITRPMNAFMLYRFAYNEHVKEYLRQRNHRSNGQAISKVVGLGWRNESPIVRCVFQELADIERQHHSTMHNGINDSANKRRQLPMKRTSSLSITADTEICSDSASSQGSQSPTVDIIPPVLEQSEPYFAHPCGLQRPMVNDLTTDSSPVASEVYFNPLLDNIPFEYGDLEIAGYQDSLSDKLWFELHGQSICMSYIDPTVLIR